MENRKVKEIEHSRLRRSVLQGFERLADTHAGSQIQDLQTLIKDRKKFEYYFSNMKFYSITESSEAYKHDWLSMRCRPGTKVLDFACGSGENALYAARCGAEVTGIDISPEGIANAANNAAKLKLSGNCKFLTMDGENMDFNANSFDYAVEYGALHHVDLKRALAELARVLKPGAQMICIEALRHNPIIHAYRKLTPHLRTEWEVKHILGIEDLKVFRMFFKKVNVKFFHLSALLLVPFRKTSFFPKLLPVLNKLDQWLLSSEKVGKYSWIMTIEISEPIK